MASEKLSTIFDLVKHDKIQFLSSSFSKFVEENQFDKTLKNKNNSVILTTFPLESNNISSILDSNKIVEPVDYSFRPSSYARYLKIFLIPNISTFYDSYENLNEHEKIFCCYINPNSPMTLFFDLELYLNTIQKENITFYTQKYNLTIPEILQKFDKIICDKLYKSICRHLEQLKIKQRLLYIYTTTHRSQNNIVEKLSYHFHFNIVFNNTMMMKHFIKLLKFPFSLVLFFSPQHNFLIDFHNLIDFSVYKKGPGILRCLGSYKPSDPKSKSILAGTNMYMITNKIAFQLTCVHHFSSWQFLIDLKNIKFSVSPINTFVWNPIHLQKKSNSFNIHASLKILNFSDSQNKKIFEMLDNIFKNLYSDSLFLKKTFLINKIFINSNHTYLAFELAPYFFKCIFCNCSSPVWFIFQKFNSIKFTCQNEMCRKHNVYNSHETQKKYIPHKLFPNFIRCCDMIFKNTDFFL